MPKAVCFDPMGSRPVVLVRIPEQAPFLHVCGVNEESSDPQPGRHAFPLYIMGLSLLLEQLVLKELERT